MQSSTVTSARTLLMLLCMIVLPVLAVLGTGWTRHFEFGSKETVGQPHAPAAKHHAPTMATGNPAKPSLDGSSQPSAAVLAVNSGLASAPRWNGEATPATASATNSSPSSTAQPVNAPTAAAPPANGGPDWFTAIQQKLRGLGATYYLLETWGNSGELYRFHCKMAVAGNQGFTRHFEATDPSAARAMQSVLEQVERWRSGQLR